MCVCVCVRARARLSVHVYAKQRGVMSVLALYHHAEEREIGVVSTPCALA